jgi:insulysin
MTNGIHELNGAAINGTSRGPLYGALDRFSQFFVEPLFLEDTLDRELRAVDSENKKNLQSDPWRLSQLQKTLSNPKHPYHHFSTGNLQTLRDEPEKRGVKIRDAFIQFYEKHYSANRMKLVVLGREPLEELETWVSELFSEVRNKDLPEMRWDEAEPLRKDDLATQIYAKPVMESRSLNIRFPFLDEDALYETQPSRFISHLIGHEGPGSILSYLKDKGLASTLSAGGYSVCPGTGFFEIDVSLTPAGLKDYHGVVKIVFQYIALMRENPPLEWMHDETKNLAEVDFRFRQKSPASRFTSSISSVMQRTLPREWLLSASKLRKFDAKQITEAIDYLRDDNYRLMITSQDYPIDLDQKEKWYGTEYKVEKIPSDVRSEIQKALRSSAKERPGALHLPHKNEFVPTRLDVEKKEVKEPAKTPKLIRNDDLMRLWWKKDDTFWAPKGVLSITMRNPLTYATPANYVKSVLYTKLVKDALTEYAYDAELAGIGYSVSASMLGIDVNIHGYNDKMSVLLEKVLITMRDLEIRPDRFEVIKEKMTRQYKNWGFQQPYYQVGDFSRWLVNENAWINPQYAAELPHIQLEDVKSFFPQLLKQIYVEALAFGNLYKEDAKKMGSVIDSILKPRALPKSQWQLRRNVIVPPGANFVYPHKLEDPANVNHAIEYMLHVGSMMDYPLRAKLQLFAQMTDEPAFDQLRSKEQLGYVVWSGVRPAATTMAYRVLIQSERHPDYLEQRIDAFLLKFGETLAKMSIEAFEGHRRSLINKRLEKLKNLESESNRLSGYIISEYFNFFQIDEDVKQLRALSKQDIQDFFEQYIRPKSKVRAKLSVHLLAQASPPETPAATAEQQKEQLVEMLGQYLGSAGVEVEQATLTKDFANVDITDEDSIVSAIKPHLPAKELEEATSQIKQGLPQIMMSLKISKGGEEQAKAVEVAKPTIIDDVDAWKSGLQVSRGPMPVTDISDYEDLEPKL